MDMLAVKRTLVAMLCFGACVVMLARAPDANAYTHSWSCLPQGAGSPCNDTVGQIYNPWWIVTNQSGGGYYYRCAKARGSGGGVKQGSSCAYSSAPYSVCLTSNSPSSQAYVYFDLMGGASSSSGSANTVNLCA